MLCERCHQNEASIIYTEIINGVMREHHICMDCARKINFAGMGDMSDSEFPFVRLLTGLLAAGGAGRNVEDSPMVHVCCPGCGMSFDEFTMVGKFGCAECYGVFGPLIEDNMKRIHGDSTHRGKRYKTAHEEGNSAAAESGKLPVMEAEEAEDIVVRLKNMNEKLREAIELENYEEAARLRDAIRDLQSVSHIDRKEGGGQDA